MPVVADALEHPVWEGAWMGHSGAIRGLEYSVEGRALLSASLDGLARLWDTEGRLLGTLDSTPRFMAAAPQWSGVHQQAKVLAETEEEAAAAREQAEAMARARALGKDAFAGGARDGDDDPEEGESPRRKRRGPGNGNAPEPTGGVGIGQLTSDDQDSMRHHAVLRRYKRSFARSRVQTVTSMPQGKQSTSDALHEGASSVTQGGVVAGEVGGTYDGTLESSVSNVLSLSRDSTQPLAPEASKKGVASSHVLRVDEPSPLGTGRCVIAVDVVSSGERAGVVFAGTAPMHGPSRWHFRMDLVTRAKQELADARNVMTMVSMIRMRKKGKGFQAKQWLKQRRASRVQNSLEGDEDFDANDPTGMTTRAGTRRPGSRSRPRKGTKSEEELDREKRKRDDDAARKAMDGPDIMSDEFKQVDVLESLVGVLVTRRKGGLVGDAALDAAV